MSMKTILVPIDFSESAREALGWAVKLGKRFDASVTVLHVQDMPDMTPLAPTLQTLVPSYGVLQEVLKARHEVSRKTMEQWLAPHQGEAGLTLKAEFAQGEPVEVILNLAKLVPYNNTLIEQVFEIKEGKSLKAVAEDKKASGKLKLGLKLVIPDDAAKVATPKAAAPAPPARRRALRTAGACGSSPAILASTIVRHNRRARDA